MLSGTPKDAPLPPRFMLHAAIALALSFGAGLAGQIFLAFGYRAPLPWLPSAIAVTILLRWGVRFWPFVLAGSLLAQWTTGAPLAGIIGTSVGVTLGAVLLAIFLRSRDFHTDFSRREDVVMLLLAVPVAMLATPTLGMAAYSFGAHQGQGGPQLVGWLNWWSNIVIGVLLLAPPLIAASPRTRQILTRRPVEALAVLGIVGLLSIGVLSIEVAAARPVFMLAFVVSIVFISMRMDLCIAGAAAFAMSASFAISYGLDVGVLRGIARWDAYVLAWSVGGMLALLVLMIRALLAEREAAERRLRLAEIAYRHGLLEVAAREQQRLGHEMHDGLGQELTALALTARSLETRARAAGLGNAADLQELSSLCNVAQRSAQTIARGLSPLHESGGSLIEALRLLVQRVPASIGIRVELETAGEIDVNRHLSESLLRIAQEALNNALKHASATRIMIRCQRADHALTLLIEDDGNGIESSLRRRGRGIGLDVMRYRAESAGGEISIEDGGGSGTRVVCTVPLSGGRALSSDCAETPPCGPTAASPFA